MSIVNFALRRPVTIYVLTLAIFIAGMLSYNRMPKDVFPDLGVPVIYVAQPYGGIDAAQMEGFVTYYYEYHFLYITGIEHVESKSIQGVSLVKLQFHPGTNMAQAMAETVSYVNRARAFMPPGTVPPFVMRFDAGSMPVGELVFSSDTRSVPEIQDAALNKVRPLFATLPGVSAPPPFGGSARTIVIHADAEKLKSFNMAPDEVVQAITNANAIYPSGNIRIGTSMPQVPTNVTVTDIKDLESVPIRLGSLETVYIRDIGTVEDSSDTATGIALVNGKRTVYIPVTKRADASTVSVVNLVKENLPKFQAAVPDGVKVSYEFDQSGSVTSSIRNLITEGILGTILTGIMVLLFLRDWRSALVVVANIPIAILSSVAALSLTGNSVNIMTLGGLALAVGILVDEATVTIENVHSHLSIGESPARSALNATRETVTPRFLAMVCVLAVFAPAFAFSGVIKALFVPLALSVGFAMISSYILSSTLVPVLCARYLKHKHESHGSGFDRFRISYQKFIRGLSDIGWLVVVAYAILSSLLVVFVGGKLGTEIFPASDTPQFQIRLRGKTGTRIEETEKTVLATLDIIKNEVGANNVKISLGYLGTQPASYPVNVIHLWTSGPEEAVLWVQIEHMRGNIESVKDDLRKRLADAMPNLSISFEPSDIVSRAMSFGSRTPIEIAVTGPTLPGSQEYAEKIADALKKVSGLRDVRIGQPLDYPTLRIDVDRERAGSMGITASDVARSAVAATSSSRFTSPNYWADPKSGIAYNVQVDVPIAQMNSQESLENIPVLGKIGTSVLLRQIATVTSAKAVGEYDRYNSQRLISVEANISGSDLGSVRREIVKTIESLGAAPPKTTYTLRGQIPALDDMLTGLTGGLVAALVAILLLLTAYFQSLKLALCSLSTAPAAIAGSSIALWLTGGTINIQSILGVIMALGVSVANAILLLTFAERERISGATISEAASIGAGSRLRPILMTSLAMVFGMLPMASGLGEGGAQSAPLGRAVTGGLIGATFATLLVVPSLFLILQNRAQMNSSSLDPEDSESTFYDVREAQNVK